MDLGTVHWSTPYWTGELSPEVLVVCRGAAPQWLLLLARWSSLNELQTGLLTLVWPRRLDDIAQVTGAGLARLHGGPVVGDLLDAFTPAERANYFSAARYVPD